MTVSAPRRHRLTPLAIVVAFVLGIVGTLLGGLVAMVYRFFVGGLVSGGLFNWLTDGFFGMAVLAIFPNLLHGGIAGGFAISVTALIVKDANYEVVAYVIAALVIVFAAIGALGSGGQLGGLGWVELVANTIGMVAGLFLAMQPVAETQRERWQAAASGSPGGESGPGRT